MAPPRQTKLTAPSPGTFCWLQLCPEAPLTRLEWSPLPAAAQFGWDTRYVWTFERKGVRVDVSQGSLQMGRRATKRTVLKRKGVKT